MLSTSVISTVLQQIKHSHCWISSNNSEHVQHPYIYIYILLFIQLSLGVVEQSRHDPACLSADSNSRMFHFQVVGPVVRVRIKECRWRQETCREWRCRFQILSSFTNHNCWGQQFLRGSGTLCLKSSKMRYVLLIYLKSKQDGISCFAEMSLVFVRK